MVHPSPWEDRAIAGISHTVLVANGGKMGFLTILWIFLSSNREGGAPIVQLVRSLEAEWYTQDSQWEIEGWHVQDSVTWDKDRNVGQSVKGRIG